MSRYSKKKLIFTPTPGWAIYLRTSDEEAQNPEASRARQRFLIEKSVLERSDMPVFDEYTDVITGRTPHRTGYQRMLEDARSGKFSHVIVERADRFGRNDTEALRAIDELDAFGVAVRFANQPDLNPMSPDDRVIVALSFTLARRESMMTSMRIKGAIDAKRQSGGFIGAPPDGYLSVEDNQPHRKAYARKTHHIEPDPERAKIWRLAWDLLLKDRLTLTEIAEVLHERGYRYRSGRSFVEVKANGKRKVNYNTLAYIFRNWAYAGWIVNEELGIPPKTLRGEWEPLVTTEEFEQGLAILHKRAQNKVAKRKHDYLLRGLIYLTASEKSPCAPGNKLYRLQCSKSNTHRPGGGTAHYRLERQPIHFLCTDIDQQLVSFLQRVQIDDVYLPFIREHYIHEVSDKLGRLRPDERSDIERTLRQVDDEEARVLRLYAEGKISEERWNDLSLEWHDRRHRLRTNLALLEQRCETYVSDLDDALNIISKLGIIYETLPRTKQKDLLCNVVERVVVNLEGKIERVELLPPFAYLTEVNEKVGVSCGAAASPAENQTSGAMAGWSSCDLDGTPSRTRTYASASGGQRSIH